MSNTIPFKNINTIFFDYDGTLHNSIKIYGHAFRKAYAYLVEQGIAEQRDWSDKEISYWLGFNPQEMWKTFMPDLEENIWLKCSAIVGKEMKSLIEKGNVYLYEGALDTLRYLKRRGYKLIFISNCKLSYKESPIKYFDLGNYFEELVCSEEYNFVPKYKVSKNVTISILCS